MISQEDRIVANILATLLRLKAKSVAGMSVDNLRQIVPTTGITLPPAAYRERFNRIATTKFSGFILN